MNPYEFVLAIVLIVTIGSVLRSRRRREGHRREQAEEPARQDPKTADRLEVLEERVAVLERIVTDRGYELRQKFRDLED